MINAFLYVLLGLIVSVAMALLFGEAANVGKSGELE